MKKVYVLTEIRSGDEDRLLVDKAMAFASREDALAALSNDYFDLIWKLPASGDVTNNEYSITLKEDGRTTIYQGFIKELEIKNENCKEVNV